MTRTTIVVPCFNEFQRLPVEQFAAFSRTHSWASLLFVNDGSTDGTTNLLQRLRRKHSGRVHVLDLACNRGKAEAVRQGLLAASAFGCEYLGFWDADLATPLTEIPRFREVLDRRPHVQLVAGVRLPLLGRDVRRRRIRHVLGRLFSQCAGWTLAMPVVDTQCGAKLFRWSAGVARVFAESFHSRWIFDVEILARWKMLVGEPRETIFELPVEAWREVAGSKLRMRDFVRAAGDLLRIGWHYRVMGGAAKLPMGEAIRKHEARRAA